LAATYEDIALRAQVSTATVSRVLAGTGYVSPELTARVRAAAEELGYRHNQAARTLRRNRSETIGLVISDVDNPFFASIARAVEDEAALHGRPVLLCNTSEDLAKEQLYLELMIEERVAGVIVAPSTDSPEAIMPVLEAGIPTVAIDRRIAGDPVSAVLTDNYLGASALVHDLLGHGHRRIAVVTGTTAATPSRERLAACREAVRSVPGAVLYEAERELQDTIGVEPTIQLVSRLALELLNDSAAAPTAFFCANGVMTQGVLQALRQARKAVPKEVALVGFDDLPLFSVFDPPVTVAAQPTDSLARQAAQLLFKAISSPTEPPQVVVIPPELRWRESCGGGHVQQPTGATSQLAVSRTPSTSHGPS
jgi:DNA-binding LacI/PurR family transcriptional regulator